MIIELLVSPASLAELHMVYWILHVLNIAYTSKKCRLNIKNKCRYGGLKIGKS